MGDTKSYPPCVQIVAAFSQDTDALRWLWKRVSERWGEILVAGPVFDFVESEYYQKTMGTYLQKQIAILKPWYDPAELATHKLESNAWEVEYVQLNRGTVARPLNIDPGYMSMTKFVLASTKNREHRIYLRDGVYAEVTLAFRDQMWQTMPWTYADYQRSDVRSFLKEARKKFAQRVAEKNRASNSTGPSELE